MLKEREGNNIQTSLDEKIVFSFKKPLQHIREVLDDAPCFVCVECVAPTCDVLGCHKLTAWAGGEF